MDKIKLNNSQTYYYVIKSYSIYINIFEKYFFDVIQIKPIM